MARNTRTSTPAPAPEPEAEVTLTTPKALASELGTDPKTFRRFLRSVTDDRAGKGGRWGFTADQVDELKARWAARAEKATQPTIDDADIDDLDA
jgi:hypothetical protein